MKKRIKTLLILLTFAMSIVSVNAQTNVIKEEIIYNKMNLDGTVDSLFVVNAFDVEKKTNLIDYGAYQEVLNTTTMQEIKFDGIKASIDNVEKGRFFYQGLLSGSTQLPWLFTVNYSLDNQSIGAKELAGQTGKLKIDLDIKQNKNVDPVYFDNYLVTITFNVDSKRISNIKAPDATIGNAGDKKTIVFTSLPKTETSYTLTADVQEFEMDGIQIAALPFSMALDLPDLTEFTQGIGDLQFGISQLNFGASQLAGGLNQLNANTGLLQSGASDLKEGSNALSSGANLSAQGTKDYVDGIGEYTGGVSQLRAGSNELVAGSTQIKEGIGLLNSGLSQFGDVIQITPAQQALIDATIVALNNIKTFLEDDLGSAVFLPIAQSLKRETVLALYPHLNPEDPDTQLLLNYMETQANAIEQAYNLLAPYQDMIQTEVIPKLDQVITLFSSIGEFSKLIEGVAQLNSNYEQFHDGLVELSNGLATLDDSSGELVSGGRQLSEGLDQLKDGMDAFSQGMNQYASGIGEVSDGISQLTSGANELSSGTQQLNDATSNIDTLMEEKIKDLMKDFDFQDFEMVSFVDKRNKDVKLVQFVYMSQPIRIPKVAEIVDKKDQKKSIWDLFLDLFR